jgi:hypothetical protein
MPGEGEEKRDDECKSKHTSSLFGADYGPDGVGIDAATLGGDERAFALASVGIDATAVVGRDNKRGQENEK